MNTTTSPTELPATPGSAVFELRTLGDIYKLPTIAQMETCLEEVSRGMIQSRRTEELMLATVEALGGARPERALEWPEVVKWSDDNKGRVESNFGGEFSLVTTKQNVAPERASRQETPTPETDAN